MLCSRLYAGEERTGSGSWEPIQSKNAMLGEVTIPYAGGSVTGNAGCLLDGFAAYTYEDYQLKTIMDENYYLSSGCGFASPPPGISYLTDGEMLLQMDSAKFLRGNLGDCEEQGNDEFLIKIQDVTVGGALHKKAVVLWELSGFQCGEADQPPCDSYIAPEFHSKFAEWGLNFPTASEQADILEIGMISHGAVLILGKGEGVIAVAGFSLEKNSSDEFVLNATFYSELTSISCTEPEISLVDVSGSGLVSANGVSGGKIVGAYFNPNINVVTAFVYENGTRTDFNDAFNGYPIHTNASDVSIHGEIVGQTSIGFGDIQHGFYYKDGALHRIRINDRPTRIHGINDEGTIVGDFCVDDCDDTNPFNNVYRGFLIERNPDGIYDIENDLIEIAYDGYPSTIAMDVNSQGNVVGYANEAFFFAPNHSFVWNAENGGTFTPITVNGAVSVTINGINNHGDMVGEYAFPAIQHGLLISGATGEQTDIDVPCETATELNNIDGEGTIVGNYYLTGAFSNFGFKLTPKSTSEALEDLIQFIETLDLERGTEISLESKIDSALDSLNSANSDIRQDFEKKMQAFILSVEAQRGKKLTDVEANRLIAWAMEILAEI